MSYGTFQGIMTLVLMLMFIGIVLWAYSARRKPAFDDAANSIFAEDGVVKNGIKQESRQ